MGLITMNMVGLILRFIAGIYQEYYSLFQLQTSYLNVLYYVMQTMTSVGYGDILPVGFADYILTMILEVNSLSLLI